MRTYRQMEEIVDVIWKANYDPYDPIIQICIPTNRYGSSDRNRSLEDATKRFWAEQSSTVGCYWSYVEDNVTKEIVGCCQLVLYDPYEPVTPKAPWWLSKEPRQFSELILGRIYQARQLHMKKKQFIGKWGQAVYLALSSMLTSPAVNWLAVLPEHRRKGVGQMLMQEATRLADEFKVATWLEASLLGKPLYIKLGFRDIAQVDLDTTEAGQTDSWRRCQHELTPGPISCMWRPVQGVWEIDGKLVKLPSETDGVQEEGVGREKQ